MKIFTHEVFTHEEMNPSDKTLNIIRLIAYTYHDTGIPFFASSRLLAS